MKLASFASIISIVALAVNANQTWYDAARDVTCTGRDETGDITCEKGHIDNAPLVCSSVINNSAYFSTTLSRSQERIAEIWRR